MKLTLLKNKKEQFQEEIFNIVFEEVKKGLRILNLDSGVKSIKFEFSENDSGKICFSDNEGIVLTGVKDIKISFDKLNKIEQSYVKDVVTILDFFVENYPIDSDDYILISQLGVECNFKNKIKQKNKAKM